jgi:hypothetical protein
MLKGQFDSPLIYRMVGEETLPGPRFLLKDLQKQDLHSIFGLLPGAPSPKYNLPEKQTSSILV